MLAPWMKSYDKPRQHIKKQRYHLSDSGPYSESYGFSSSHVQIWELDYKEGWTPENWYFQTIVWRRLESPWTRWSSQSILRQINPEYSLEGLMLKPKLQYSGHLMGKASTLEKNPWCWKRLRAGKEGVDRGWDGWMHHGLNGHEFGQSPGNSKG